MWLLILSFILVNILVAWLFFGYFILVWFLGLLHEKRHPKIPEALSSLSLVVPCFNESAGILSKLEDIRALSYPKELLEVVFVDGGSTDNTVVLLSGAIREGEPYRVLISPEKGKINQLNFALSHLKNDIIINSDTDARLTHDALEWIAAEFAVDSRVSVVGAYCSPVDAIDIERYYWSSHNKGRLLESDLNSSSIVIAQCYAFRKGLIKAFPDDVIADDIYIAFFAHARGDRVVYSRHAKALETRSPKTHSDFIRHKFRKSNAFLRESLRFIYLLPEMGHFCKVMFLARVLQQLALPWLLILWLLIAGSLLTTFRYDIVTISLIFLGLLFALTNSIFSRIKLPEREARYSLSTMTKGYILTLSIMLITGISYPFFRQDSVYSRLENIDE